VILPRFFFLARWDAREVRVFNLRWERILLHPRLEPGRFSQVLGIGGGQGTLRANLDYWLARAGEFGAPCAQWAQGLVQQRGPAAIRSLMGLAALTRQHSFHAVTLARYLKPDLVLIDDMGHKSLPPKAGEALLEIILRRYENRSTIMTSNRPLEEWGKLLQDVPTATAILDRFLHRAEIIQITGRSYRLKRMVEEKTDSKTKKKSNDPFSLSQISLARCLLI
jgi:hypothetical protein